MKRLLSAAVAGTLFAASTHDLIAEYVPPLGAGKSETWTGAGDDGQWNNALNWSGKAVPTAEIGAFLPGGVAISIEKNATANWIETTGSGTVLLGGSGTLQIAGLATTNGAGLEFGCALAPAGLLHSVGSFSIVGGGAFTLDAGPWENSGDVTIQANATMNLQGSKDVPTMPVKGNLVNLGTINVSNCALAVSSNFTQSGTLTVNNGYATCASLATGGSIQLQNSEVLSSGPWTVTGPTTFNLVNASNRMSFADSSSQDWTGTVSVDGWASFPNNRIQIGNNKGGLSVAELNVITFQNVGGQERNACLSVYGYLTPDMAPLNPPFVFVSQPPAAINIGHGGDLELSVSTSRPTDTKYQWQFNGTNIPGQDAPAFVKRGVSGTNGGLYDCVATSDNLTMTSTVASVVVGPKLLTGPLPAEARGNGSFEFTSSADGTTPLQYQWMLNGAPISGATSRIYCKSNAMPADDGKYSVTISNRAGSVTSVMARLVVLPYITQQPTNAYNLLGDEAALSLTAIAPSDGGQLSAYWYYRGWSYPSTTSQETDDGVTKTLVSTFNFKVGKNPEPVSAWVKNSDGGTNSVTATVNQATKNPLSISILSPADNVTFTNPAGVTVSATATTPNLGAVITNISYYAGNTLIGSGASAVLSSPSSGPHTVTVVASDSFGTATTNAVTFTVAILPAGNLVAPAVILSLPATNWITGKPLPITVTASNNGPGSISTVELLVNSSVEATNSDGTNGVFTFDWTPTNAGDFNIQAVAFTPLNVSGGSDTNEVSIYTPVSPAVSILPESETLTNAASLTLSASATPQTPGATITNIQILDGTTNLGTSPVTVTGPTGLHVYTAVATDSYGLQSTATTTIQFVSIPPGDLQPPNVSLSAPSQGVEYLPTTFTVTATNNGPGSISSAELLVNGSVARGASESGANGSYCFTWTPPSNGTYSISAEAFTAQGIPGYSSAGTFTAVNYVAPVVNVSQPSGTVIAGQVQLTANATDSESQTVTGMTLFIDGGAVATSSGGGINTWLLTNSLAAGTHTAWASASDAHSTGYSATNTFTLQGTQNQLIWSVYDPGEIDGFGQLFGGATLNNSTAAQGGGEFNGSYDGMASVQPLVADNTEKELQYNGEFFYCYVGLSTTTNYSSSVASMGNNGDNSLSLSLPGWSTEIAGTTGTFIFHVSPGNEIELEIRQPNGSTWTSPWGCLTPGQTYYPTFYNANLNSSDVTIIGGLVVTNLPFTNVLPATPALTLYGGAHTGKTDDSYFSTENIAVTYSNAYTTEVGDAIDHIAFHEVLDGTDTVILTVGNPATNGTATLATPPLPQAPSISYYAISYDRAGNASGDSPSVTVQVIATTPPTITLTSPTNGQVIPPSYPVSAAVSASDPQSYPLSVTYYLDESPYETNSTSPYGATLTLAAGTHTLYATACDGTYTVCSATNTFTAAFRAPTITLTPSNNSLLSPGSITFQASAVDQENEPITGMALWLQGTQVASSQSGGISYTASLGNGTYAFYATASDGSGTGTSATYLVNVDTAPAVAISVPSAVTNLLPTNISYTVAANGPCTVVGTVQSVPVFTNYNVTGAASSSWSPEAVGSDTVTVKATDQDGLSGTSSASVSVVTYPLPQIASYSPGLNATNLTGTVQFTATAADPAGQPLTVTLYNSSNGHVMSSTNGSQLNFTTNMAAGTYSWCLVASDPYASTTNTACTLYVDLPPQVAITTPTNNAQVYASDTLVTSVTATDQNSVNLAIYANGNQIKTATNINGTYTFSWAPTSVGSAVLTAIGTDPLGYSATNSVTISVLSNPPPTIALSDVNGSSITSGTITFWASATEQDGKPFTIYLYINGSVAGSNSGPTISYTTNIQNGTITLSALVVDALYDTYSPTNTVNIIPTAQTTVLLHMNGTNNGTAFPDSSAYNSGAAANGTAATSTNAWVSGGASLSLNGSTSSYLELTGNNWRWNLNSSNSIEPLTAEAWVYLAATNRYNVIAANGGQTSNTTSWAVFVDNTNRANMAVVDNTEGVTCLATGTTALAANTWYSIYAFFDGFQAHIWVNGVLQGSSAAVAGISEYNEPLTIGAGWAGSALAGFDGYIDEFRMTQGGAIYSGSYVPLTDPGTNLPPMVALVVPSATTNMQQGASLTLAASAICPGNGDYVTAVDFLDGTNLIAQVTNLTGGYYAYTWLPAYGAHSVSAVAYNEMGSALQSASQSVTASNYITWTASGSGVTITNNGMTVVFSNASSSAYAYASISQLPVGDTAYLTLPNASAGATFEVYQSSYDYLGYSLTMLGSATEVTEEENSNGHYVGEPSAGSTIGISHSSSAYSLTYGGYSEGLSATYIYLLSAGNGTTVTFAPVQIVP